MTPSLSAFWRAPRITLEAFRLVRRAAPREALLSTGLQVLSAALVVVQLALVKLSVERLVQIGHSSHAWSLAIYAGALVVVTVMANVLGAYLTLQQRLMSDLVGYHTMDRIVDVATQIDFARYEEPGFHDQLERARNAAMYRPIEIVTGVTSLITALVTSVGIGVALLTLAPLLVPIVALGAIPVLLVALRNSQRSYAFQHSMTARGREQLHLVDILTGPMYAKELRVTDAHLPLRDRYNRITAERVALFRRFLRQRLRASLGASAVSGIVGGLALGTVVWLLATHRTTVATAATALVAVQLLGSRLQAINASLGRIVEAGLFLDDYRGFLALLDGAEPLPPVEPRTDGFPGLTVEHLTFSYPAMNAPVLKDVTLELAPGEVVALVGANGSGKTTLVKLLCGLYRDLDAGRLMWGERDAKDLLPEEMRSEITVLFQDFVKYELSVADNISLGRADAGADRKSVEEAARQAGIYDVVNRLPNGFDTRLGRRFEGGAELSGGQWQRVALARAFYRGGGLLVLDEPTASLDPRAESELFAQIRGLAAGKAVLLISHRFSSVRTADRIYVLEEGRIVEQGTHEELLSARGTYAELYELQAAAYFGSRDFADGVGI